LRQIHLRLSPNVSVALSNIPNSNCPQESWPLNLVKQEKRQFSLSVCEAANASCVITDASLDAPGPWRRANQFGDLMGVLKFGAIHLDYRSAIAEQNLSGGPRHARLGPNLLALERAGFRLGAWERSPHRTLDGARQALARPVLPNDLAPERILKIARRGTRI